MPVLSLLVMIVGAVVYVAMTWPRPNPSWIRAPLAELGRLSFFAGLLAYLIVAGQHVIRP